MFGWFTKASLAIKISVVATGTLAVSGIAMTPVILGANSPSLSIEAEPLISGGGSTATKTPTKSPAPEQTQGGDQAGSQSGKKSSGFNNGAGSPLGSSGMFTLEWSGSSAYIHLVGNCNSGPIRVRMGPPNWGYLSTPIAGIQALGGSGSGTFCSGSDTLNGMGVGVSEWKCFNFSEIWIEITGNISDAGLLKVSIPNSIPASGCPAGADQNNPTQIYDPNSPPQPAPPVQEPIVPPPAVLPETTPEVDNSPSP